MDVQQWGVLDCCLNVTDTQQGQALKCLRLPLEAGLAPTVIGSCRLRLQAL